MKNKKRNKKGFTLVEVIVVLVILAILAAILVPAMIGWINKANEKVSIVEARNILLAAQTVISANYGESLSSTDNGNELTQGNITIKPTSADMIEIFELADIPGNGTNIANGGIIVKGWKIDNFTYETDNCSVIYHATAGDGYEKGFTIEPK